MLLTTVFNNLRRNPFQANTRGIDFTAHRQLREQAEAEARAQAEAEALALPSRKKYGDESAYDDEGGLSRYAPTGLGHSVIAPPGGSVFIPARSRGPTAASNHYNETFPPRREMSTFGRSHVGLSSHPAVHVRGSGSTGPSILSRMRPGSPEFPAKGW